VLNKTHGVHMHMHQNGARRRTSAAEGIVASLAQSVRREIFLTFWFSDRDWADFLTPLAILSISTD
jgi:hypothetical protein